MYKRDFAMRFIYLLMITVVSFFMPLDLSAQIDDAQHEEHRDSVQKVSSIKDFFTRGHIGGHARYYGMGTVNYGDLKDWYANGIGGVLEYRSAIYKRLQIGVTGLFIYNIGSSDFTEMDELTGLGSRYEIQLFDMNHPDNKTDLDRLDELFLKYHFGHHSFIKFGKQGIYTPLMNMQDTRMKPYILGGFWGEFAELKGLKVNLGWFDRASVRSTTEWVSISESIGVYENGFTIDGKPAQYKEGLETDWVGVAGVVWEHGASWKAQLWNYLIHNISNTAFAQLDFTPEIGENQNLILGAQMAHQEGINEGGSAEEQHRYIHAGHSSAVYGLRAGLQKGHWSFTLNYLQASKSGRFVFPREWGREQFYTTVSRGRMEGMGGAQQLMGTFKCHLGSSFNLRVDLGRTIAPDSEDFFLNKHQQISYDHFNFDLKYVFKGAFKGLDVRWLYVYKRSVDDYSDEIERLYYMGNYHHFNLIANVKF